MAKRVVWSKKAKNQRLSIFEFWLTRTDSNRYTIKLRKAFKAATNKLKDNPFLGKQTNTADFRFLIVKYYKLFYTVTDSDIVILSVFDTRQDPDKTPY